MTDNPVNKIEKEQERQQTQGNNYEQKGSIGIGHMSGGVIKDAIVAGVIHQTFISESKEAVEIHKRRLELSSPYLGLNVFKPKDAAKFFGRDEWTKRLLAHLSNSNRLLLTGYSGSGKSSLIMAGLIPQLEKEEVKKQWKANSIIPIHFVPDVNPFERLYISLISNGFSPEVSQLARNINSSTLGIVFEKIAIEKHCLIYIDQFEEIFIRTTNQSLRKAFIDGLTNLLQQEKSKVKVIMTMRSDFYGELSHYPELMDLLQPNHVLLLTDMTQRELRLAIREPAAINGVTFEDGLVEQIVGDFYKQAGSLPLLQYTLDLLWEKDKELDGIGDRTLNFDSYEKLDGVGGALQHRADQIYYRLTEDEQEAAKQIFLGLIDLVGNEPVRRRAYRSEVVNDDLDNRTLDKLIENRLIVIDKPNHELNETVEVTHEELLRSWSVLQSIIDDKKSVIQLRNELTNSANKWNEYKKGKLNQKANSELWRGSKLEEIINLINRNVLKIITKIENDFIFSSRQNQLEINIQVQPQQIIEQAKKGELLNGIIKTIQLVDESLNLSSKVHGLIQLTLSDLVKETHVLTRRNNRITSIAPNSDGSKLAIADQDGFLQLWDMKSRSIEHDFLKSIDYQTGQRIDEVKFSPDDTNLAALYQWGIYLLSLESHSLLAFFELERYWFRYLVFSPNGKYIANICVHHDNYSVLLCLWEVKKNKLYESFKIDDPKKQTWGYHLTFSPDGQYLAVASSNTLYLWEVERHKLYESFKIEDSRRVDFPWALAFSPDGQYLAVASSDILFWNIEERKFTFKIKVNYSEQYDEEDRFLQEVYFSGDGQHIVTLSYRGDIHLWDVSQSLEDSIRPCYEYVNVNSVLFNQVNNNLILQARNFLMEWNWRERSQIGIFDQHESDITAISYCSDSKQIVSAEEDGTIRTCYLPFQEGKISSFTVSKNEIIYAIDVSSDGKWILAGTTDKAYIYESGIETPAQIIGARNYINGLTSFSPKKQNEILLQNDYGNIIIFNLKTEAYKEIFSRFNTNCSYSSYVMSDDRQYVVAGGSKKNYGKGLIDICKIEEEIYTRIQKAHENEVTSVDISKDGNFIISGCKDGIVKIWDFHTHELVHVLEDHKIRAAHRGEIEVVKFTADGSRVASSGRDGIIQIWNIKDNSLERSLRHDKHISSVYTLCFSPDDNQLASGGQDGKIRIWDLDTGILIREFYVQKDHVYSVKYTADGSKIVSGGSDGVVRIHSIGWQDDLLLLYDFLLSHSSESNTLDFSRNKLDRIFELTSKLGEKYVSSTDLPKTSVDSLKIIEHEDLSSSPKSNKSEFITNVVSKVTNFLSKKLFG